MRVRVAAIAFTLAGCAAAGAPVHLAPPPPPPDAPEVAVLPPAPAPPPEDPAVRERADDAVLASEQKLEAIAERCERDWLEPENVCKAEQFESFATDFQAYYADHAIVSTEGARIDSLLFLGGPTSSVEQVTTALTYHCEERCRKRRLPQLEAAAMKAADQCFAAKSGFDACKAFVKKMSATVRPVETERWADECYGVCDDRRAAVKSRAAIDAQRPTTPAAAAACKAKCRKQHDGGWCGTGLLSCLSLCAMKGEAQR
ncbi:MAG: hypothetical protein KIT84_02885 [Labilithrix sp.]|nr:hypothetical protein [Labilithrix sp.]MCW5809927.1 hypothetical protein [Labilithrix sp.]